MKNRKRKNGSQAPSLKKLGKHNDVTQDQLDVCWHRLRHVGKLAERMTDLDVKSSGIFRLLRNVSEELRHTETRKVIGCGLKEVRNSVERVHRLIDLIDPNHLENIMLEMELQVCLIHRVHQQLIWWKRYG
jgi:hypothetical protein